MKCNSIRPFVRTARVITALMGLFCGYTASASDHICEQPIDLKNAMVRGPDYGSIDAAAALRLEGGAKSVSVCELPGGGGQVLLTAWYVVGEPGRTYTTVDLFSNE
jgi:hypothetical protein